MVLAAFLAAAAAGAVYVWNQFTERPVVASEPQGTATLAEDKLNKRINILLLGVDDGDDESKVQRSDTMIVASI
ncbi:MAG TPA: LytR family transcriptional regulator, partial [Sporomusaceae bacterium]|nr:LytR family transcriptional regulator [Sporomusaceae bacterium]